MQTDIKSVCTFDIWEGLEDELTKVVLSANIYVFKWIALINIRYLYT